jgi:hypothetical protein
MESGCDPMLDRDMWIFFTDYWEIASDQHSSPERMLQA